MPQSLSNVMIHLIFSTKNREPFIAPGIERDLHRYMAAIFKAHESPALTINGTQDHIHALFTLSRTQTIAGLIEEVKKESSKWMKRQGTPFKNFYWQTGYGTFSIGNSGRETCLKYIANQKPHHREKSFQDEYRMFLRKYNIKYDERYVWD